MKRSFQAAALAGTVGILSVPVVLLAQLLGVEPGFPQIAFDNSPTTGVSYDSASDLYAVSSLTVAVRFDPASPPRPVTGADRNLTIQILVDAGGALIGGVAGDDLTINGEVDEDGNGSVDFSSPLLTGEILDFGHADSGGPTDQYDFRFAITGGSLASLYPSAATFVVKLTSESSTFAGDFRTDFSGRAKGSGGSQCDDQAPPTVECSATPVCPDDVSDDDDSSSDDNSDGDSQSDDDDSSSDDHSECCPDDQSDDDDSSSGDNSDGDRESDDDDSSSGDTSECEDDDSSDDSSDDDGNRFAADVASAAVRGDAKAIIDLIDAQGAFDGESDDDSSDDGSDDHDENGGLVQIEFTASDDCKLQSVVAVIDIGCKVIPVQSGQIVKVFCNHCDSGSDDDDSSSGDDSDGDSRSDDDDSSSGDNSDDDCSDDGDSSSGDNSDGDSQSDDSDSSSDDSSDDLEECTFKFVDGILVIHSDVAVLIVTATDSVGNVTTCTIDLCQFDDDDSSDDGSDDDSSDDGR